MLAGCLDDGKLYPGLVVERKVVRKPNFSLLQPLAGQDIIPIEDKVLKSPSLLETSLRFLVDIKVIRKQNFYIQESPSS